MGQLNEAIAVTYCSQSDRGSVTYRHVAFSLDSSYLDAKSSILGHIESFREKKKNFIYLL